MILLTGGAGYIGSHTLVALLNKGYKVVVFDNLSTGHYEAFNKACQLAKKEGRATFLEGDIRDMATLRRVFSKNTISAVIHLAGKKSIAESCNNPAAYYENNIMGSKNMLCAMNDFGVDTLVFGSSVSVYAAQNQMIKECSLVRPTNPYSKSKAIIDAILERLAVGREVGFGSLRYSNPIGCIDAKLQDYSADNLVPSIVRVSKGAQTHLNIFGDSYQTEDGTAVRDYVDVKDIAEANVLALEYLMKNKGYSVWNIASSVSLSVKEVISIFERANDVDIPYQTQSARAGDIAVINIDNTKAFQQLGWQPSPIDHYNLINISA